MDLLNNPPPIDLYDRAWIIHTRTEERPPAKVMRGAMVEDSMICDGCVIESGAQVMRSILSPGVYISAGSVVHESILLTDTTIGRGARIERAILDKRVCVGENSIIGDLHSDATSIPMIGKNAILPPAPGGTARRVDWRGCGRLGFLQRNYPLRNVHPNTEVAE